MNLTEASQLYLDRRNRKVHPDGSFDRAGRFYPSDAEACACCGRIRGPSRSHPYSYMTHCRTVEHVAHLTGVDVTELRKEVRRLDPPSTKPVYKKVAQLDDGRLVSLYDGVTEYAIGKEMTQPAKPDHAGGYYIYPRIDQALHADVHVSASVVGTKHVILECKASGRRIVYDNAKRAVSHLVPTRLLTRTEAERMVYSY